MKARTLLSLQFCLLISTSLLHAITPNSVEIEIANLAKNHSSQGRSEMVYDPILNMVARAKARDLAMRGYFDHVDPDGYGPNKAVQLAGYALPGFWGTAKDTNYIESISAGYGSAAIAFQGWMDSAGHRRHLLAEIDFYASQTRYGVGYANVPGSPYTRYYVFISTPPNGNGSSSLEPHIDWLFNQFRPEEIDTSDDMTDHDGDGIERIYEFVLQLDPKARDEMPLPTFDAQSNILEWTLPIRDQLGSYTVYVEGSFDLGDWSSSGVERSGNSFQLDAGGGAGFLRLIVSKP